MDRVPSGETTYLGWLFLGLQWTVLLSFSAWALALAFGIPLGMLRTVPSCWLRAVATGYVAVFRNIPLLVQLFIWYFVMPELVPMRIGDAFKQLNPLLQEFVAGLLCLGLFTGARITEQVRAGIESVGRGQKGAGLALGLSLPQTYRYVLLPMGLRIIVPPLTSEFLNCIKNSAVATTIGFIELSRQAQQLVDYTAQPYEAFIAVTVLYLVLNGLVMIFMRWVERRVRVPGFIVTR
ncbi:MAG: amino acid ABC transporter permease [Terriglobales bacterium]